MVGVITLLSKGDVGGNHNTSKVMSGHSNLRLFTLLSRDVFLLLYQVLFPYILAKKTHLVHYYFEFHNLSIFSDSLRATGGLFHPILHRSEIVLNIRFITFKTKIKCII